MIRELSYNDMDAQAYPASASLVATRLLYMAPSVACSAALVHMSHFQQVCPIPHAVAHRWAMFTPKAAVKLRSHTCVRMILLT